MDDWRSICYMAATLWRVRMSLGYAAWLCAARNLASLIGEDGLEECLHLFKSCYARLGHPCKHVQ